MLRIVDPVGIPRTVARDKPLASRLSALDGSRLGFLINEAGSALVTNWPAITVKVEQRLQTRHRLAHVFREIKPKMSAPAGPEIIDRFVRQADGVVNGLGK